MSLKLTKGQKIDLTKTNPTLKNVLIGLGWDVSGDDFDLDAAAFLLDQNGKARSEGDFIFYNNLRHESGAIEHMGDSLRGELHGDDEQIKIDLLKMPPEIKRIAFTVTIYDAENRKQNFRGTVASNIGYGDNGKEILRYNLGRDFSIETAIIVAEIYRHAGDWKFQAIGSGFSGGLAALGRHFGLKTENKTEQVTVALYPVVKSDIKKLAALNQCSMSDVVNEALKIFIENHRLDIKKFDDLVKNLHR